jgi:1-acyl-sn-glycerol-3-phosphate acyltransferase
MIKETRSARVLGFLPGPLKGLVSGTILVLNSVVWTLPLYPLALVKMLAPNQKLRDHCTRVMIGIAELWAECNRLNLEFTQNIHWDIQGVEGLRYDKSYLICANHQSWVDIFVLQRVFNRKIPFMRFFLKQELIWVPLMGGAWWALDFPFMKRYSKSYLDKHPEKRGEDLKTTRLACERFRGMPIAVINFLEGTRFTPMKHKSQASPYKHLLKPKAGGVAFVLECMGDQFDSLLDVTIQYPKGAVPFIGMLMGRMPEVVVRVEKRPIPRELLGGGYLENDQARDQAQAWVRTLWNQKDELLDRLTSV